MSAAKTTTRRASAGLLGLAWLACAATADPAPPRLLSPTFGRPLFSAPGGPLLVVAESGWSQSASPSGWLVEPNGSGRRIALTYEPGAGPAVSPGAWIFRTPADVHPGTYDLRLGGPGGELFEPHCVAILRPGAARRMVHLSNLNLGDPFAPRLDPALIDEINLVGPDAVIATGDYLDATHADPQAGWRDLCAGLARLDAPVIMACGDHDDLAHYSRFAAPSPVGLCALEDIRVLLLHDHPLSSALSDEAQMAWLEAQARQPGYKGTMIVGHDERPNVLERWRSFCARLPDREAGSPLLYLAGGHRDWDGREYARLVELAGAVYCRTGQGSTALRDGADGRPRYRVIDWTDGRLVLAGAGASAMAPPSNVAGRLKLDFDAANDGSANRIRLRAVNANPWRLDRLRGRVRVAKRGEARPWAAGLRLAEAVDRGGYWECQVEFDLPDKSYLRGVVGVGAAPPPPAPEVRIEAPSAIRMRRLRTAEGIAYCASDATPRVQMVNPAQVGLWIEPRVLLDGAPLSYAPDDPAREFALGWRLRLEPGARVSLRVDLSAVRVAPGERTLQVYVANGDVETPAGRPLQIEIQDASQ